VKRWEALADGVLDAAVAAFSRRSAPMASAVQSWIDRQRGKIDQALKAMSDDLGEQPWCHGTSLSLADIAVGCALGYVSFRLGRHPLARAVPQSCALYEKLMQRPAFAETVPQPA
jgi:glutathione S-transferase